METTFSFYVMKPAYAMFILFVTTPISAQAATTTAKIIPITNIINSFLFYTVILIFKVKMQSLDFFYFAMFILLLIITTSAIKAATTANDIPIIIIIIILSLFIIRYSIFSSAKIIPFCVRTQFLGEIF